MNIIRKTVRGFVFDPHGRLLLVRMEDAHSSIWVTPGGGLDPEEDILTGIRREMYEETGIEDLIILDEHFFSCEHDVLLEDQPVRFVEQFVLASTKTTDILQQGRMDDEKVFMKDVRWFERSELSDILDTLQPPDIRPRIEMAFAAMR